MFVVVYFPLEIPPLSPLFRIFFLLCFHFFCPFFLFRLVWVVCQLVELRIRRTKNDTQNERTKKCSVWIYISCNTPTYFRLSTCQMINFNALIHLALCHCWTFSNLFCQVVVFITNLTGNVVMVLRIVVHSSARVEPKKEFAQTQTKI